MSALPDTAPAWRGDPAAPGATRSRPAPGTAGRRPPPPLRLVPPRSGRSLVAFVIGLVLAGVLAVVALQAQSASAAFEARALEREVAELQRRHEELTAEVAALESPERMRRIAMEELGMVPADDPTYLDLSGDLAAATWSRGGDPVADPVKQARTQR